MGEVCGADSREPVDRGLSVEPYSCASGCKRCGLGDWVRLSFCWTKHGAPKSSFILTSYVLCRDGNGFLNGSDVFNGLKSALVMNKGK
jgi:hypothetical protein